MQKLSILKKIIPILIILGIFWVILLVSQSILQKPLNSNINYLPSESSWSAQVDINKLVGHSVESILLSGEDRELEELINDISFDQDGKARNYLNYGVHVNSSAVLFGINSENIVGALVNLSSVKKFKKNVSKELNSFMSCYANNNVGIVLVSKDKKKKSAELLSYAKQILSSPSDKLEKSADLVAISIFNGEELSNEIIDGSLSIELNQSSLLINGKVNTLNSATRAYPSLSPEGFHFDINQLTRKTNESLQKELGIDIPSIKSFSLNYINSELVSEPKTGIVFNADLLIQFEENINPDSLISILTNNIEDVSYFNNAIEYNGIKYHYSQLDSNTVYIGKNEFNSEMLTTQNSLLSISGNPEALTNVEGQGLTRRLLGIIPIFKASEHLSSSIENVDIQVAPIANSENSVIGSIIFKQNQFPLIELLKFMLIARG